MKKRLSLLLVCIFVMMSMAGCQGGSDSQAETSGTAETADTAVLQGSSDESYYMCVPISGVEYWFPVFQGMKDAAKALGVNCYYMGTPEYDPSKQVEVFDQILAMEPTGILVHPITGESFVDPIQRAVDADVKVVTFAADSPDSARTAYVTSDNEKEGNTAAENIAQALDGKGEVMVMRNPGQTNHETRCDSFIAYMEENYPNISVVAEEVSGQDADKTYQSVMTVAQAHPDLAAVFTPEATSAVGAAQAGIELGGGKQKLLVSCCDTSEQVLDLLKDDQFFAAIAPDQYLQGYISMLNLFFSAHNEMLNPMNSRAADGENLWQVPYCDNGLSIVTKENADSFYISNYCEQVGVANVDEMLSPYEVK